MHHPYPWLEGASSGIAEIFLFFSVIGLILMLKVFLIIAFRTMLSEHQHANANQKQNNDRADAENDIEIDSHGHLSLPVFSDSVANFPAEAKSVWKPCW